ncbi:MAG: threonine synthase [Candidatus Cloacimonetes bacterium]|nr:threonine synthase [Candidatus Cloacimonadota bacterium]
MKFILECVDCGRQYDTMMYLCPQCAQNNDESHPPRGVLKTLYDYQKIKSKSFRRLQSESFLDLLPLSSLKSLSYLRIGNTPLYKNKITEKDIASHELYLKDDAQNPTFSYKDRASGLVCAYALEQGINTIIAASTGNAGSSLAGIGASQGQRIIIIVPASAPAAKLLQIAMYGAIIVPVKGSYDEAFDLSMQATEKLGYYNRNTAYNPLTIEGKKTASFEIYAQLGEQVPERIFVPVGDGCIIAGVYKGWEDLLQLGMISRIPQIIAVQAAGSSSLVKNLDRAIFLAEEPDTIADSISVKIPRNFYMAKKYLKTYQGDAILVSDREIQQAAGQLAQNYGIFSEPAAASAFAGYLKYRATREIGENSRNIVMLTGSGLKDIAAFRDTVKIPQAIKPDLTELEAMMRGDI